MSILNFFRSSPPADPLPEPKGKRGIFPKVIIRGFGDASGHFESADADRLTSGWTTTPVSALRLVEHNWRILCARGREVSHNTAHGRKFLRLVRANIVGPHGVHVAPAVNRQDGTPDKLARTAIAEGWREWSKAPEVTGQFTLRDLEGMMVQTVARDGEVFVRKLKGRNFGPYLFQLQLIDPDRIPVDYKARLSNGNRVRAGIEFTAEGKPVAYYIRADYEDYVEGREFHGAKHERIPADEMFHLFIPEMINQPRGLSWMGTAMKRLKNLSKFEEAAVINARVGASKMGFFQVNPDFAEEAFGDEEEFPMDAEPGAFERLPAGHTFAEWNPQYPQGEFEGFHKACLHNIAVGLGVSYASLSGDLSEVNYSSIRAGALDERDLWMDLQEWFISRFIRPLFEEWVKVAVLAGAICIGSTPLRAERVAQYQRARYQARRWKWADPSKEVAAARNEHAGLMKAVSETIREQGRDPDEVFEEIREEREMWQGMGLSPVEAPKSGKEVDTDAAEADD